MIVWSSAGRSKVEAMTSPLTERCMSVTSSGRSSTSTTIRCTSGLFVTIAFAMDCSTIVLPALGGDTISPRWPLPIGATRSMTRVVRLPGVVSRRRRSCGYRGVSFENSGRLRAASSGPPLTVSIRTRGVNFSLRSPSGGAFVAPVMASPLRRPLLRTIDSDTYTSLWPGR